MTTHDDRGRHPLDTGCPPEWASAWGHDHFGVFVEFRVGDVDQRMRWIRPGIFLMGSPPDDAQAYGDEHPQHLVRITTGFWLADTPVTQALWQAITGENPSHFRGDPRRPVEQVSWDDCQHFCAQLQGLVPGPPFHLPTEAEWEYACRAGTAEATYADKLKLSLDDIAWYNRNSGGETHPVREKAPNPWGLYDTLGNVREWCSDRSYRSYSESGDGESNSNSNRDRSSSPALPDPQGPATGGYRVFRGGSWYGHARGVRAAYRHANGPGYRSGNLGLRLAREQGVRQDP